jgi:hypothetical protein
MGEQEDSWKYKSATMERRKLYSQFLFQEHEGRREINWPSSGWKHKKDLHGQPAQVPRWSAKPYNLRGLDGIKQDEVEERLRRPKSS